MGNCSAGCFQSKESLSAAPSDESLSETSSSDSVGGLLSTYKKTKNGENARVKKIVKKKESSVITRKAWTRNRNRVAPCSNGTASGTRSGKTCQGRQRFLYHVSSSSGSSDSSMKSTSSSFETESSTSYDSESYEESSSRSSYSERDSSTYDDSSSHSSYSASSPSLVKKPGVTQGRLIIVQPCRSAPDSYQSSSSESMHSACTIRTTDSDSDSSSSSSCSRDMGYSDDSSEDDSCKVHPY